MDIFDTLPLTVSLLKECNYKCGYCYPFGQNKSIGTNMNLKEAQSIIDASAEAGFKIFKFTGGEPTNFPDFEKVIDHTAKAEGVRMIVVTNGINLGRYIDLFGRHNDKLELQVSLDSTNSEHKRHGIYKVADERLLGDFKELANRNIKVRLNMVVTKANDREVPKIFEICEKYGFSLKLFNLFLQDQYIATDGVDGKMGKLVEKKAEQYWRENFVDLKTIAERFELISSQYSDQIGFGIVTGNFEKRNVRISIVDSAKGAWYNSIECFKCDYFTNICEKGVYSPLVSSNMVLHLDDCYNKKLRWPLRNLSHASKVTSFREILKIFDDLVYLEGRKYGSSIISKTVEG